jgi:hypothetical protein
MDSSRRGCFLLLALSLLLPLSGLARERFLITKDSLVEMFENIAETTDWDMSGPMLWGYFFTHGSKGTLERVAPILESQGYRLVDIHVGDKDSPEDPDLWWLHVERVETHTPDSLNDRNRLLYQFADEHGVDTYDGMDVGPAPN